VRYYRILCAATHKMRYVTAALMLRRVCILLYFKAFLFVDST